jgi:hypothetical protein
MKKYTTHAFTTLAVLVLAGSAFAGAPLSKNIKVLVPVTVNGTAIPVGEYKFNLSEDGQVSISSGKKVLATAQGKIVDHATKADSDSLRLQQQPDGSQKLMEIEFGGKKTSLVLSDSETKSSGN